LIVPLRKFWQHCEMYQKPIPYLVLQIGVGSSHCRCNNTLICRRSHLSPRLGSMTAEQGLIIFDAATASSQISAKLNYRPQAADTSIDADIYLFTKCMRRRLGGAERNPTYKLLDK
ncbi:MAG: hypothetical protein V7L11_25760, partial [Nostoc sp.]